MCMCNDSAKDDLSSDSKLVMVERVRVSVFHVPQEARLPIDSGLVCAV